MNKHKYIILVIIFSFVVCALFACNNNTPTVSPKVYTIEFNSGRGGRIEGKVEQSVVEGESTESVTAIADTGYYFAGWADLTPCSDETVTGSERVIENVAESRYYFAYFERVTLRIEYIGGANGHIDGDLIQSVKYGDSTDITASVTAVPNKGYRFVGWSDGVMNSTRHEQEVTENKELTANFEIIRNTYQYNYKYADSDCDEEEVTLTYGQLEKTQLAVPKREYSIFDGWYADRYLTQKVADEDGNIVVGDEFFDLDCTRLNAKWVAENTHPYKILIVYVTEINAKLNKSTIRGYVNVEYKMTELERKICHMITEKISFELNDLAIADFQVSEYFTQIPVTKASMRERHLSDGKLDNELWPQYMPELTDMLGDYDSVIVSFSLGDFKSDLNLHLDGGSAEAKFANVHFDGRFDQLLYDGGQMADMLNPLHGYWDHFLGTYLHELAHTIELRVNDLPDFHSVVDEYIWESVGDPLIAERRYFLNKAVLNGETVGVPFEFWEGKVATVYYEGMDGGYIAYSKHHNPTYGQNGRDDIQYVIYGNDAIAVTAMVHDGYEFVGWSDGVESAMRQDLNIYGDLHIYAIFKLKE